MLTIPKNVMIELEKRKAEKEFQNKLLDVLNKLKSNSALSRIEVMSENVAPFLSEGQTPSEKHIQLIILASQSQDGYQKLLGILTSQFQGNPRLPELQSQIPDINLSDPYNILTERMLRAQLNEIAFRAGIHAHINIDNGLAHMGSSIARQLEIKGIKIISTIDAVRAKFY